MTELSIVIPNARSTPVAAVTSLIPHLRTGDHIYVVRNRPANIARHWKHLALRPSTGEVDHPLLTVLDDRCGGAASARNTGWRTSESPYVLFLDDDVVPDEALLPTVRSLLGELGHSIAVGLRVICDSATGPAARIISLDRGPIPRPAQANVPMSGAWRYGVGAALLVSRDILEATGGFKNYLGAGLRDGGSEDLEFLWHASRHGCVMYAPRLNVAHPVYDEPVARRKLVEYGRAMGALAATADLTDAIRLLKGHTTYLIKAAFDAFGRNDRDLRFAAAAGRSICSCIAACARGLVRRQGAGCDRCA